MNRSRSRWLLPVAALLLSVGGSAFAAPVVVVRGDRTAAERPSEAQGVDAYFGQVRAALDAAGLAYERCGDADVERGALAGHAFAIFAYSSVMTEQEIEQVRAFVEGGGRVMFFYTVPEPLLPLLGLTTFEHVQAQYDGQFGSIAFDQSALSGLPGRFAQGSWNIHAFGTGPGVRVLGRWVDTAGKDTGYAAVTINDNGAYMGHVLLEGDTALKGRMLLAIVGHFAPEVLEAATRGIVSRAGRVGRFGSIAELRRYCREAQAGGEDTSRSQALLGEARQAQRQAVRLVRDGRFQDAISAAEQVQAATAAAYYRLFRPRAGEVRGVWMGAFGVPSWEETMANLARNGFNAVFPNMCSGGIAHYKSDVLPRANEALTGEDHLEDCIRWGKRYGVAVHVWRINWYLSGASPAHIKALEQAGRLQVSASGEVTDWLCPSQEINRRLELDAMVELVRKYDVDGIHFDYIRYPDDEHCYCDHCRRAFEAWAGTPVADWPTDAYGGALKARYREFRRHQITRLVADVAEEVRRIRPEVIISAAVFGNWQWSRDGIGQDARAWVDQGIVDMLCPMDYTNSDDTLARLTTAQVQAVEGRIPLCIGIGAFSSDSQFASPTKLADQIDIARRLGGDGFVIFSYNKQLAEDFLPAMREGTTAVDTFPSYQAPRVAFEVAPSPSDGDATLQFAPGASVTVAARVQMESMRGQALKRVRGKLLRENTEDGSWAQAGEFDVGEPSAFEVPFDDLQPGRWRLTLEGRMDLASGESQPFIRRGPVLWVPEPQAEPAP